MSKSRHIRADITKWSVEWLGVPACVLPRRSLPTSADAGERVASRARLGCRRNQGVITMAISKKVYATAPEPSLTRLPMPDPEVMAYHRKRCADIMRRVQQARPIVNTVDGDKADEVANLMNAALREYGMPPASHQALHDATVFGMALSWVDHGDRSYRPGMIEEHFMVAYALCWAEAGRYGEYGSYAFAAGYHMASPDVSPNSIAVRFAAELATTNADPSS